MAYELTEEDKIKDATRLINSALRTQNRTLRRSLEKLRAETDAKIAALLEEYPED